jgi:hypothetical protein
MYSSFLKYSVSFGIFFCLLTACAEEIVTDFPSSTLSEEENLVFSDTSLCIGQPFTVRVRMNAGSSNLTKFEIYEDDVLMSADRIQIQGSSSFSGNNPIVLVDGEQQSINYLITIDPMVDIDTTRFYFFRAVDELNQPVVASVGLDIGFPGVKLLDVPNVISSDSVLFIGEDLRVRLQLDACWQDLESLEILEDGTALPDAQFEVRLAADSSFLGSGNPFNLQTSDRGGTIYDVTITPSQPLVDSTERLYTFRLLNTRGQVGSDSIVLRSIEPTPLELASPLAGVLLINQAAGEGNGGLDLDTGESVDATAPEAEIQDEGIVTTDNPERNWRRQISVVDPETTEMRKAQPGTRLSDFLFQEQLVVAYNRGLELEGGDSNTDNSGNAASSDPEQDEEVSLPVSIGDVFIIRREGMYYAIECTDWINEIADNQDRYIFSVLY